MGFSIFKPLYAQADTITNDPIHPYIYELIQAADVNTLNFMVMSNNENVTEKFKNQLIIMSNNKLNASAISKLMIENNLIFTNKSQTENTKSSYSTSSTIVRNVLKQKRREDYVYDENYKYPTLVEYVAIARWQVHIGNNNIITYAGQGNIEIDGATPSFTDIFSSSYSYSLMNNGYTSKLLIRFTIKTGFSNSQAYWYKISKPLSDDFYYHSIVS